LQEEKRNYELYQTEPKLLILGTSDSGKSTLLKQLQILHGNGFSDEIRRDSKKLILSNILQCCNTLMSHSTEEVRQVNFRNEGFPIGMEYSFASFQHTGTTTTGVY
jgi:energy-coupling factor transporter ATP-binding protein EcfA2